MHKVNLSGISMFDLLQTNCRTKGLLNPTKKINEFVETKISIPNTKLIMKANELIEDTWLDIKFGNVISDKPLFYMNSKKHAPATLEPVYGGKRDGEMLLEIQDQNFKEKIFINRTYPKEFRYEKEVQTEHGNATVRYYDSKVSTDTDLVSHVNECIWTYLSKLFSNRSKHYSTEYRL